ncbi:MAG: FAD:protein FMN transferase [Candidatus Omnitrophica bacterium]|nr:FAD:protein FMN transferase [Candidatus Omnitrophota bacterium]
MAFGKRTRIILSLLLAAGWASALIWNSAHDGKSRAQNRNYRNRRVLMGTFWEVTSPDKNAAKIVFDEAGRIEKLLSKYIPQSEVSRLNRKGKLKVSAETFFIIRKSKEFWRASGGAFDISVAPLADLWGFTDMHGKIPQEALIKKTLGITGSDKILLHENDNVVEFKLKGMKIDLGAIAKGYAIDLAAEKLRREGIKDCLINAGGQIYAMGDNSGSPWKVAIRNPRGKEFSGALELKNKSVATSGDYEQFFLEDGKRYCHIIDPRSGYPVNSGIASVTVVENSALNADALSTAVFVLGEDGGKILKDKFPDSEFYIKQAGRE